MSQRHWIAAETSSYRLWDASISPMRPTVAQLGGRRFPSWVRYVVRDGSDCQPFADLHSAIVYHGVATQFMGDIIRLVRNNRATKSTMEPIAVITARANVDWGAYGWR